jgi:hypothetical protein
MSFKSDLRGLERLIARAKKVERPDCTPLMATWMKIIEKDNREGILKGEDKDGAPMVLPKYRPIIVEKFKTKIKGKDATGFRLASRSFGYMPESVKLTAAQKNTNNPRRRTGVFGGFGPMAAGLHNNLTPDEYRMLDGPPLAPRRQFSRVITNLVTGFIEPGTGGDIWTAVGAWREVVSVKGIQFLPYHFSGAGRLPVRNLAGVRPEGRAEARRVAVNFFRLLIRGLPVEIRGAA